MPENFKDFADSYTNHHDFSSVAEGSNLVWWAPCFFLAKKETKLPSRQVTHCKAHFQMFFNREDMGSAKEASIPLWKAGTLVAWDRLFQVLSGH